MPEAVYSRDQVELYQQKLERLSQLPRTTFTKRQVVEELIDTIEKALLSRSYEEVAEGLKEEGLEISAGSLKQYVSKFRRSQKNKPGATGRKRATKAQPESSNGRGSKGKAKTTAAKTAGDDLSLAESRAKGTSNRTSNGFLEMDEDL